MATLREIDKNSLDLTFSAPDVDYDKPISFRQYLKALVGRVIDEQEGFSGKRPFGNSGWIYDLQLGLVQHGLIHGEMEPEVEGEYPEVKDGSTKEGETTAAMLKMVSLL